MAEEKRIFYTKSCLEENKNSCGEMSSMDLQATVPSTFVEEDDSNDSEDEDEMPANQVWGRLFPERQGFNSIDLIDDEYSFGRSETCSFSFTDKRISNKHCIITREQPIDAESQSNPNERVVFILDNSANGTFLNGTRLGKGKKVILAHNDKISFLNKKLSTAPSYIYHDLGRAPDQEHAKIKEKYTLERKLGSGMCGEVHLARDKSNGRKYAIKTISKKTYSQDGSYAGPSNEQLLAEVDILLQMKHPNIIRIHDMVDTRTYLYIVLEFAAGGELFDRVVDTNGLGEEETKYTFMQLLDAVQCLHKKGVAHRDLKPENILLSSKEKHALIKVTDFGLAKLIGPRNFMNTQCGTPTYQAPEVLDTSKWENGEGYGFAVDMWSLGVILFILLVGYPPFSEERGISLNKQIIEGDYDMPDEYWGLISDEAKDLVRKLILVDPKKRLSVDEALEHPFMKDEVVRSRVKAKQDDYRTRRLETGNTQTSQLKRRADRLEGNGELPAKKDKNLM
eukprot:m.117794 g.117794  ORF g.117794 m.117794 type:complete len:508 (+) comp12881_c0_seq4:2-1525(+)